MRALVVVIVLAACSRSQGTQGTQSSGAPTPTAGARDDAAGGPADPLAVAPAIADAGAMLTPPPDAVLAPVDAMPPRADATTALPPTAGDLRCKSDRAAGRACAARGNTYVYGSGTIVQCGGHALPPDLKREREAKQRAEPCECLERAELERRGRACRNRP